MTDTLLDRFLRYVRIDTQADERSTTYPSSPGSARTRPDAPRRAAGDRATPTPGRTSTASSSPPSRATSPARRPSRSTPTSIPRRRTRARTSTRRSSATTPAATSSCRRTRSKVIRVGDNPELNDAGRQDDHHHRRHDAARRRRQGRRGGHHGGGPHPGREPGRSRTGRCRSCSPATRRSARACCTSTRRSSGRSVAYTLDGAGTGEIEAETFSADTATVTITGVNIHPAIAKGRMVERGPAGRDVPGPAAASGA